MLIGCPTLYDMHQITLSHKYVIPVYKKLKIFLHHLLFPPYAPKIQSFFKINKGKMSHLKFSIFFIL
jgi:hypothetical protein